MNGASIGSIPQQRIFDLVEKLDTRGPRYTSYPTVPVWQDNFPATPFVESLARLGLDGRPIAVYLHLPFCKSRCLYCGCNSYISCDAERLSSYGEALLVEIERVTELLPSTTRLGQLHLGGGTPTHTPAPQLAEILDRILARIPAIENAERSIEVDPRVTTDDYLKLLTERGFNRISIGLQDLDPAVQNAVHRVFSFGEMSDFVARARSFGFKSVNIDLIYGLPLQTADTWEKTLRSVLELSPDRLACFGYAHLPSKIRHQQAIRDEDLPSPRARLAMLLEANRVFTGHGYEAIGMDHFAKPDDELSEARRGGRVWRNFMGYTTNRGMELLGLGCSSISEFDDLFVQNIVPPEAYGEAILAGKWAVQRGHSLDLEDRVRKQVINHLMCNLEIRIPDEARESGNGLVESLGAAIASLKPFEEEGLILAGKNGYDVTPLGQLFLRNLAMPFDRYLAAQTGATFSRTV